MAESSLSVQYTDLESYVARFAGWDTTSTNWTTQQAADFQLILKAGLRKFYFPPGEPGQPSYGWNFLRKEGSLGLELGVSSYFLPEDFAGRMIPDSVCYAAGQAKKRLLYMEPADLNAIIGKVATASNTGTPVYYTIKTGDGSAEGGYRWRIVLYPTPNSVSTLKFIYPFVPEVLSSTNKYPYGGAMHSATIVEACLAATEEILDDDPQGVHQVRFLELLGRSIQQDQESRDRAEE